MTTTAVTTTAAALARAAQLAAGVASTAAKDPLWACALINDGEVEATDGETRIRVPMPMSQPLRAAIPAKTLADVAKLLPDGEVELEVDAGKVTITAEGCRYQLLCPSAEDYPAWRQEDGKAVTLPAAVLRDALASVVYALPARDHRRVLLGVHVEVEPGAMRLTATDGKQLARVNVPASVEDAPAIVAPRGWCEAALRILPAEGPARIAIGKRQIAVEADGVTVQAMGIDGKYPDCDQVIPRDWTARITLDAAAIKAAAKRAGVTTDDKTRSIALAFKPGRVEFSSMAHDLGTFAGSLPILYDGAPVELAFNFRYLMESLDALRAPRVVLHVKSSRQPVVLRPVDGAEVMALLMPIKVTDARPAADE